MKICKSDSISAIVRVTRAAEQDLLAVAALGAFSFDEPGVLLGEDEVWRAAKEAAPQGMLLDEGMSKARAEFLLAGSCYAPRGAAVSSLDIRIGVGERVKRLAVFGDRRSGEAPAPFVSMPLDWSRAYGGPTCPDNPLGKGAPRTAGASSDESPNIEAPRQVLDAAPSQNKPSEPAGYGPIRPDWGSRLKLAGVYDQEWLRARWPWFPVDMNPDFFNMAPRDQWLEGYLRGDERISLRNLHPTREEIAFSLRLPTLRVLLIEKTQESAALRFRELEARAETLWLLPNQERGIIIWRTVAPVADKKASDIEGLALFDEPRGAAPCDARIYAECYRANFADAEPEAAPPPSEPTRLARPTPAPPPAPPAPDPTFAALCVLAKQHSAEADAAFDELLQSCGAALPAADSAMTPAEALLNAPKQEQRLEPSFEKTLERLKAEEGDLEKMIGELSAGVTLDPPSLDGAPDPDQLLATLRRTEGIPPELDAFLAQAQADNAAWDANARTFLAAVKPATSPEPEPKTQAGSPRVGRAEAARRLAAGESLAGIDLRGEDLRGLDLAGADLANAQLLDADLRGVSARGACFDNALMTGAQAEGADLRGARLRNAVLERADLSRADVSEADLSGARLTEAQLPGLNAARATLRGADLSDAQAAAAIFLGADLSEAVLNKADLRSVNFERAHCAYAVFDGADAANARFTQAKAECASFVETRLDGADFTQAELERADFGLARLDAVVFKQALAANADFYGAVGEQVCFTDAKLPCSRADETTAMPAADFRGCDLSGANWSGAELSKAALQRATLTMSNFSNARLIDANLSMAVARQAKFVEADLCRARLLGVDLLQGNLSGALLHAANFTAANLFEVEFLDAHVSPTTCFTQANLGRTKLARTHEPKE